MADAVLATETSIRDTTGRKTLIAMIDAALEKTSGVRWLGSPALNLAYVAAGRHEGFWESGLSPWDVAGGIVIVREAGGMVSEIDGRGNMLYGKSIMATNQELYDPIRKLLVAFLETKSPEQRKNRTLTTS